MRKYLATLHERPEHHKKRFALAVSGCFTLLIFAVWAEARFGVRDASQTVTTAPPVTSVAADSPLQNLKASAEDSWQLLRGEFGKAKDGLKTVDVENAYTQVRNDALSNQYGQ